MANRLDHSGTFEMTLAGACVCVRRHTIKTSGHEGAVTESQLHLEEVKELHGQTRLRVKKEGGIGVGRVSISSWYIVEC